MIAVLLLGLLVPVAAVGQKSLKVALLLTGPIDDHGWNASAYEALQAIKKELGATTAYAEKVAPSDYEEMLRGFAVQGFDLIIGHAFAFGDPAERVAAEFPSVKFLITNSTLVREPNIASLNNDNVQLGFLAGVVGALVTKTGTIGSVGAMKVPSVVDFHAGLAAGARYINPSVKVLTAITGSFQDAAKGKEMAIAMIDQGADVITHLADRAGLGAIEAARERKVMAIGNVGDQAVVAPETIVTSATARMDKAFVPIARMVLEGTFRPQCFNWGIKEGVVGLAPFRQFEGKLSADQKARIQGVVSDLESGRLDARAYVK